MRVRVALALLLRILVIERVIHVLIGARLHRLASLGVVSGQVASDAPVGKQLERADGTVPVVDEKHAPRVLVDRQVAGGRAAGAHRRAVLRHGAGLEVDREGNHLAVHLDGLRARVDDRQSRVTTAEGRIVHEAGLRHGEERERALDRVKTVRAERTVCGHASGPVRKIREVRVGGDEHNRPVVVRWRRIAQSNSGHHAFMVVSVLDPIELRKSLCVGVATDTQGRRRRATRRVCGHWR